MILFDAIFRGGVGYTGRLFNGDNKCIHTSHNKSESMLKQELMLVNMDVKASYMQVIDNTTGEEYSQWV